MCVDLRLGVPASCLVNPFLNFLYPTNVYRRVEELPTILGLVLQYPLVSSLLLG